MALITESVCGVAVEGLVVAPQQRHRTAQSLQVVAASAGRATVNPQVRVPPAQLVPVSKITFDVPHFGEALPVRCIVGAPIGQGIDIEILPVEINTLPGE